MKTLIKNNIDLITCLVVMIFPMILVLGAIALDKIPQKEEPKKEILVKKEYKFTLYKDKKLIEISRQEVKNLVGESGIITLKMRKVVTFEIQGENATIFMKVVK